MQKKLRLCELPGKCLLVKKPLLSDFIG